MDDKITQNVLDRIKSGRVKMHSKTYFGLRAFLSVFLVLLVAALAWFLFSLILFSLQRHGAFYIPLFGLVGIRAFIFSFPWFIFGFGAVLFILLDKLMNNYPVVYRRPVLYMVLGILAVTFFFIGIVHAVGLNDRLHEYIKAGKFPGLSRLYEFSEEPMNRSMLLGRIEELTEDGFVLLTGEGKRTVLQISPETRYPNGSDLKKGETVIVGVEINGEKQSVYGVRKIQKVIIRTMINGKIQNFK